MGIFDNDEAKRRVIEALKFVKVATKNGYLTDISVAMLLVEMKREGVGITAVPRSCHGTQTLNRNDA
jgi:hypothetical protein